MTGFKLQPPQGDDRLNVPILQSGPSWSGSRDRQPMSAGGLAVSSISTNQASQRSSLARQGTRADCADRLRQLAAMGSQGLDGLRKPALGNEVGQCMARPRPGTGIWPQLMRWLLACANSKGRVGVCRLCRRGTQQVQRDIGLVAFDPAVMRHRRDVEGLPR